MGRNGVWIGCLAIGTLAVSMAAGCAGKKGEGGLNPDRGIKPDSAQSRVSEQWLGVWERLTSRRITEDDLQRSMSLIPPQARLAVATPEGRQKLIEELRKRRAITLWALDQGLFDDPEVQWNVGFAVEEILASMVFAREIESQVTVSDDEVRAAYDANPNYYAEWRFSSILVAFEPNPSNQSQDEKMRRAMEIREKIEYGEDFAETAKTLSDDKVTGREGGLMGGWFNSDSAGLDINIVNTLKTMQVGEIQGPVRTMDGYNIIKLDQARPKPFESVREKLRGEIRQEKIMQAEQDFVKRLEEQYPVITP